MNAKKTESSVCLAPSLGKIGRRVSGLLLAVFGFAAAAFAGTGITVTYTWVGAGNGNNLYTVANWLDNNPPPGTSVAADEDIYGIRLFFGDQRRTYVEYGSLYANQIEISGNNQPYFFKAAYTTTHIGSGGIIYNPAQNFWSTIDDSVQLHASQVWDIQNGTLALKGRISDITGYDGSENAVYGQYQIEKTGAGNLALQGGYQADEWAGGLLLTAGTVTASANYGNLSYALGFGTLVFNGGTLAAHKGDGSEYSSGDDIELYNNIISNGLISINTESDLYIAYNEYTESDFFRLDADTTLQVKGKSLFIDKDITESGGSRKLTIDSSRAVVLYGSSDWHGGTQIDKGVLIFAGEDNTPGDAGSIVIGSLGYAGIGADNNVGTFLNEVDLVNSTGAIGFDSDPEREGMPDSFTDTIDLTGANTSLRLGSATAAILGDIENMSASTEQIIPAGDHYRFGNGGGSLYVASLLTNGDNPRGLKVDSHAAMPLSVWLLNPNNNFTGDVYVNNSALIYGPGSAPDAEAEHTLTGTGYVGTADEDFGNDWLNYFSTATVGIIGFDISPGNEDSEAREIENLSMSAFSSAYAGTASALHDEDGDVSGPGVVFSGTIDPNSDGTHRFAAYKGGALEISGTLTGSSMIIGNPDSPATFGDIYREAYSTVFIGGDNSGSLANGTTIYGGQVLLGQGAGTPGTDSSTALGSGALTVAPVNFTFDGDDEDPRPLLGVADADDIIIGNNIVLNTDLGLGGNRDFTLAGTISGTGELYVGEDTNGSFELTLSGANSFTGGVYVGNNSTVILTNDTSAGAGVLGFGDSGGSGSNATFLSQNPVVHGLNSDGSSASINFNYEGPRTFTIMQEEAGQFTGSINASGESTIIKDGAGTLRFDNTGIYSNGIEDGNEDYISLEVKQGTLVFSNDSSLSGGTVKVSGGTFALSGGQQINRPVIVSSGGRLGGFGTYSSSISIGNGAILAPGLPNNGATGSMQFYHLELDGGGVYEYNIQSPDFSDITGHDVITVNNPNSNSQTLVINADSDHPFIIKVISLDSAGDTGTLTGIDEGHGLYSWTLINFDVLSIPGNSDIFDPALFSLDVTAFTSDALYGGEFSLFQQDNKLMLGFTPVPEPSTYAMMALGLGIVAWTLRRRRTR